MNTVKKLYEKAFESGILVQTIEQSGEQIDGRTIWNQLENETKYLKDKVLTIDDKVLKYNMSLKSIYSQMNEIIIKFQMDKYEFEPKSNHFFCQLMNLVDKKSNYEIKLNKIMQLGFNAGQLSVFLKMNKLPLEIKHFYERYALYDLDTYVDKDTQQLINDHYLKDFIGGKNLLKKRKSKQNKRKKSKRCSFK